MQILFNRFFAIAVLAAVITAMTGHTVWTMNTFPWRAVLMYLACCLAGYFLTSGKVIPYLIPINIRAGMSGRDIYLKGTPGFEKDLPECLGIGVATVYFCILLLFFGYFKYISESKTAEIISSCLGYISFGTFLGFVDDVLELRWRDKIIFPFFFSILIIFSYEGDTKIIFPEFVKSVIGLEGIEFSFLFYIYLILLSIFATNSINIYAGISGLETGQSLVIGMTLIIESLVCLFIDHNYQNNLYSIIILGPFCAVTLALYKWNKVESKTFVGDTYCYFAGSVLAASGIIGKSPIKLLLFFIPQLFNFVISLPQLFGIVHCPRHRLPTMDLKTGKLNTTFPQNLNLINFALWLTGPLSEKQLSVLLVWLQTGINLVVVISLQATRMVFRTQEQMK
jgi:UDP-N-acetylglucosamine--dolichyl-phosphate N-acetylglucosaminephosphotransferase